MSQSNHQNNHQNNLQNNNHSNHIDLEPDDQPNGLYNLNSVGQLQLLSVSTAEARRVSAGSQFQLLPLPETPPDTEVSDETPAEMDIRQRSSTFHGRPRLSFQISVIDRRSSIGILNVTDSDSPDNNNVREPRQIAIKRQSFPGQVKCIVPAGVSITDGQMILENSRSAFKQAILPLLAASLMNVFSGLLLDVVQKWPAFEYYPQLIILTPALMGLKNNVEVAMANRLSTEAILGKLDNWPNARKQIIGNVAVIQCQDTVTGSIAPFFAILLASIAGHESVDFRDCLLIFASAVTTTSLVGYLDGAIICLTVFFCRKLDINPNNIAPVIASSLGDITVLVVLSYVSDFLFKHNYLWLIIIALLLFMILTPTIYAIVARHNQYTRELIVNGWWPIIVAMIISVIGGAIMEKAIDKFDRLAQFSPVVNGIGGNISSILAGRLTVWLFLSVPLGELPPIAKICIIPGLNFFPKGPEKENRKLAVILLVITAPIHLLFLLVIRFWHHHSSLTFPFVATYLLLTVVQLAILLYLVHIFVLLMWSKGLDPDNFAHPFLTAISDLLGSLILAGLFWWLLLLKDPNGVRNKEVFPVTRRKPKTTTTMKPNATATIVMTTLVRNLTAAVLK